MTFSQIMENGWVIVAVFIVAFIVVAGLKANTEEHGGSAKNSKSKTSATKKELSEDK